MHYRGVFWLIRLTLDKIVYGIGLVVFSRMMLHRVIRVKQNIRAIQIQLFNLLQTEEIHGPKSEGENAKFHHVQNFISM